MKFTQSDHVVVPAGIVTALFPSNVNRVGMLSKLGGEEADPIDAPSRVTSRF